MSKRDERDPSPLWISSKEPAVMKQLMPEAIPENWPEDFGLDYAWFTPFGVSGVQRKEFPGDFLSSLSDERLHKEVLQMEATTFKFILLEGKASWGTNGELQGQYAGGITRNHLRAVMWSIDFFHKIRFVWTASKSETIDFIRTFYNWTRKYHHTGFGYDKETPKIKTIQGDVKTDWREWILQHIPGFNQVLARSIINYYPEPLHWWDDGRSLQNVPGIGQKRADTLIRALKPSPEEIAKYSKRTCS